MADTLVCWQCGADLIEIPLPFGRRSECPACHAELHACRMCRHYDTTKAKQCREPVAEPVLNKTRANFCDWFQPQPGAYAAEGKSSAASRVSLDDLFGGPESEDSTKPDTRKALDDLFGG